MNILDLREAQARYIDQIDEVIKSREQLYKLRSSFVKFFNSKRILSMDIDDYVAGVGKPDVGLNFCYTIERQLDGLGRIIGATAFKFGVFWSKENNKYLFTKKFGKTYKEAFESVRQSIIQLLIDGKNQDIISIVNNKLSPMFKGKILCCYFPERYLNVFSDDHLNYFLVQLGLDTTELIPKDSIYKREALLAFKNKDSIMREWSVDLFANFLYTEYPGRPPKERMDSDPLLDYKTPVFPANPSASFIDLSILATDSTFSNGKNKNLSRGGKPDYEKEARKLKKLGDRGEKIVMDLEKQRLIDEGRKDLAKKIERVSLQSDKFGYDILSYETDGSKRLIEVKATNSKVDSANFFFTANELLTAEENENYFIYMVYDVTSDSPKVWAIKNPFNPINKHVRTIPINYRVTIKIVK